MDDLKSLQENHSGPSNELVKDINGLDGDIMILGAGGKMGPDLAKLAKRALTEAGKNNNVIAVSKYSNTLLPEKLSRYGIETITADLLDVNQLNRLPDAPNIIYMAGLKFGTTGNEPMTWVINTYLPGKIADRFRNSRIVVFSTGNVYPFVSATSGGATEKTRPDPVGEYAQSCLGRERIFEYYSKIHNIPMLMFRLNYAIDFRYGILVEIARSVMSGREIDLTTGFVNLIWQRDANEYALRCMKLCAVPPSVFNVTGPETVSIRELAVDLGNKLDKEPVFINSELPTALLSNASAIHNKLGLPGTSLVKMIDLVLEWIKNGGEILNKPTHFQERKGNY